MVINTNEKLSKKGEMLKAFTEAVSDLLSNKDKFDTMIEGFFNDQVYKIRSEFKVLDYKGEISHFVRQQLLRLDGDESANYNYLRYSKDIYRNLEDFFETKDRELKPFVNKLFEANKLKIVWDYQKLEFKLVSEDYFHGFFDFDVTSFITLSKKVSENKRFETTKKFLNFIVCEEDDTEERAEEVLNLFQMSGFKTKIKRRVESIYNKDFVEVGDLFDNIDFGGYPLSFCNKDVGWLFSEIKYKLTQYIRKSSGDLGLNSSFYSSSDYSSFITKQSTNLSLILKELFSESNTVENLFSKNLAVKRFASDIPGLEYLRPERDKVVAHCRRFVVGEISEEERTLESNFPTLQYLFAAYSINLDELLKEDEKNLVLKEFVNMDSSYCSLGADSLLLNSIKSTFKNSGIQSRIDSAFSREKSRDFFIQNKEYIKSELGKLDNSFIKNPIIRMNIGEYGNELKADLLSLKDEFVYNKKFLDKIGILYNPTINIDLLFFRNQGLDDENIDKLLKAVSFAKLLLSENIISKIILSCKRSQFEEIIRKSFSEKELQSIELFEYNNDLLTNEEEKSKFEQLRKKVLSYSNFLSLSKDYSYWLEDLLK